MAATSEELPPALYGGESSVSQQQASSSSAHHAEHDDRESERKKRQRKAPDPEFWNKNMDPEVWSNLPPYLTLEVYKNLPLRSFFQLREVCRDWNRVSRERRCVTDPIHKPCFGLIHHDRIDDDYAICSMMTS